MTWEVRQNRLRTIFGRKEELCFQVFCIVKEGFVCAETFDRLAKEHQRNPNPCSYLPWVKIGQVEFSGGLLALEEDGSKSVCQTQPQSVFTSMDQNLIKLVQAQYADNPFVGDSNDVLELIMAAYINKIEDIFPNLRFDGKRHAYSEADDIAIEFKFAIQPYDFAIHPPRDMDVLKSITAFRNNVVIHPTNKTLTHRSPKQIHRTNSIK